MNWLESWPAVDHWRPMILYHSPGACSLVPHIALHEAQAGFEAVRVLLAEGAHHTPEYLRINPHARVPALQADGQVITENIAILNFIAQRHGSPGAVPLQDPAAAARTNELLGWFASSVHIGFAQLWRPERFTTDASVHEAIVAGGREVLAGHFAEIEDLIGTDWLVPGHFTAADGYALTFFRWGRRIEFDMATYPRWGALVERIVKRPAVMKALASEGFKPSDFHDEE